MMTAHLHHIIVGSTNEGTTVRVTKEAGPLTGFTIAVTAARRADELDALLTRRGAAVVRAPAIEMIPLADDDVLREVSEQLIADPPDMLIATTGIGFRGWLEVAETWKLTEPLLTAFTKARIISRGPKATGAIRAAGLKEEWSPDSESSREVVEHLTAQGIDGLRIAVQLHGATDEWDPAPEFLAGLRAAGAIVTGVPVYRWTTPIDTTALDSVLVRIVDREIDAVAFTSAPAVASTFMRAAEVGLTDPVRAAFGRHTTAYCVGPVTAGPLRRMHLPSQEPERMRLGALARLITEDLPTRTPTFRIGEHTLSIRSGGAVVDGELRPLSPVGLALLRTLAAKPGAIVTPKTLLQVLPGGSNEAHAAETAIARLRAALGVKGIIATVFKRGYRLPVTLDDEAEA